MNDRPLRWAIAGTGRIAGRMAEALAVADGADLVAVCSRTTERARRFADEHGVARAHGSYEALADDDEIDLVYVATPNHRHHDDTVRHLRAGHHVLCEKPMALDAVQVTDMARAAREHDRFLMEAMWSRFLPSYRRVVQEVGAGRIGRVLRVDASLGIDVPFDAGHRLHAPELGGGSILDLGVYTVNLAVLLLGPPESVTAEGHLGPTGVDERTFAVLGFGDGAQATSSTSVTSVLSNTARITGTDGVIELSASFHRPEVVRIEVDGVVEGIDAPLGPAPLHHQVLEVQECVRQGRRESPTMPVRASLEIATVLDEMRRQVGVAFPGRPTP